MKTKLRNIIVSFALALICGGATSGALIYKYNDTKEVKAADATTQRIYLNALAAYNNSSDHWDNNAETFIYFNDESYRKQCTWKSRCILYVDVPLTTISQYSKVSFKRVNKNNTNTVWNNSTTYTYSNGVLDKNLCILTGWNASYWCSPSDFYVKGVITSENKTWSDNGISMTAKYTDSNPIYELCATGISLTANDNFKLYINQDSGKYFDYSNVNFASGLSSYFTQDSNKNIKVTKDITVDIYFKPLCNEGYENNNLSSKKIYIQENSEVAASNFADKFVTATGDICSTGNTFDDHSSALSAIWSTWKTNFSNLTVGAKASFNTSDATNITNARERYIHIVTRYTSLALWTSGPSVSRASGANRNINLLGSDNAALFATTIIALVAAASFGAYALLRKKKVQ